MADITSLEGKLADAQREIANAVKLQEKAAGGVVASDMSLYKALQVVRELGDLMKDDATLQKTFMKDRKYVDAKGNEKKVGYGKATQKNVYVGLVKLAFSKTKKSSLSQYAKVLKLAEKDQPDSAKFAEWIKGEHDAGDGKQSGIKGALKRANLELLSPTERKKKKADAKKELDLALQHFLKNATKIDAPQISMIEGPAKALVYYDKTAGVLYVDEYKADKESRSVAAAIKAWKGGK